jgi:hypothetical protein
MNDAGRQTIVQRFTASLVNRLSRHVTWHGSADHNLAGEAGRHYPLVLILGREHYKERLEKVLRQELAGEPPTLSVPGPVRGDRREVSFYIMQPGLIESLPRSLFIIPESVVLGSEVTEDGWADVERQDYRYFLFADGSSQPAGGALARRELVALAAGVDLDRPPDEWRGSAELLGRMRRALLKLPGLTWWACRNPLPRRFGLDAVAWKPAAVTAAMVLFGYLVVSSLYLQASLSLRNGDLDTLRPQIQEGLATDEEARDLGVRRNALAEEMRDGRVRFYGEAADAAEILTLLAAEPGFKDVTFDSAVRSGRNGRQNFTLSFALAGAATDREQADE